LGSHSNAGSITRQIAYGGTTTAPVAELNSRLDRGEVRLEFARSGYLRSLLVNISTASQLVVFAKDSVIGAAKQAEGESGDKGERAVACRQADRGD
jgi:hypothetical protein